MEGELAHIGAGLAAIGSGAAAPRITSADVRRLRTHQYPYGWLGPCPGQ